MGPLLISATIEASSFKFGTQLRFGEYVTITAFFSTKLGKGWLVYRSTSKIVCTKYHVRLLYHITAVEM